MLTNIKAVLFDLDGTLMDSMWLWHDIDVEYLSRYGCKIPDGLQQEIEGMSFTETAQYFKERFSIPDDVEQIKSDWNRMAFEKYAFHVPLKKGAYEFLNKLRSNHIDMAIASSNSRELIQASLKNNHVQEFFREIIISCDVPRGKPAPDIYLHAASLLQVRPEECLVFEDIPNGILAGKSAGMKVCAVYDEGASMQTDEIRKLADYYIQSYDQIINQTYEVLYE